MTPTTEPSPRLRRRGRRGRHHPQTTSARGQIPPRLHVDGLDGTVELCRQLEDARWLATTRRHDPTDVGEVLLAADGDWCITCQSTACIHLRAAHIALDIATRHYRPEGRLMPTDPPEPSPPTEQQLATAAAAFAASARTVLAPGLAEAVSAAVRPEYFLTPAGDVDNIRIAEVVLLHADPVGAR